MELIRYKPGSVSLLIALAFVSIAVLYIRSVESAPTSTRNNAGNTNDKNNGNSGRLPRASILSSLFRRQTSTANEEGSSSESDIDDPQAQTELEAQKFMDSLPNPVSNAKSLNLSHLPERVDN